MAQAYEDIEKEMQEKRMTDRKNGGGNQMGNPMGIADLLENATNMARSFEGAYKQISDPNNKDAGYDMARGIFVMATAINERKPEFGKSIMEYFSNALSEFAPTPYKPLVKGIVKRLSKEPWDVTMGYINEIALELGKDPKSGSYLPTEEVLRKAAGKLMQREIVENLRRAL